MCLKGVLLLKDYKYGVYLEEDLVATDMTYEVASILAKGLFEYYHDETNLLVSIMRMSEVYNEED